MLTRVRGIYYGWVLVLMLGVTQTITWGIVYYGFSVFLPPMESDLGWSRGPRLLMTAGLVVPGAMGVWSFIVVFGASRGMMSLLRPLSVADLYGRERFASISGAMSAFVTAVAPLGAGVAYDLMGSYDPLIWSFVLVSALAAVAVLLVRPEASAVEEPERAPAPGHATG